MKNIDAKTRPSQIMVLKDKAKYLMYKCQMRDKPAVDLTFEEMHEDQPGWNINSMIYGISHLAKLAETQKVLYDIYEPEDWQEDPGKEDVKAWFMPAVGGSSEKPFIIDIAGGAYTCVCSLVESFPSAARFNELGYHVFVITYRVMQDSLMPKPLEDIAASIKFIQANKEVFGIKTDEYIVNGYSAGANAAALWGTESKGYGKYHLNKPKALFPIYPIISSEYLNKEEMSWYLKMMFGKNYNMEVVKSYDIPVLFSPEYPPCYIVHAKDDPVVPADNSIQLKKLLDQYQIKSVLELPEKGSHGFGDGCGTDAAGWPDRAIDFAEQL